LEELNEEKDLHQRRIDSYNEEIMTLTKVLKPVDDGLMGHNLEKLIEKKSELERKVAACEWELTEMEREFSHLNEDLKIEQEKFDGINYDELVKQQKERNILGVRYDSISANLTKIELQIGHNQSKIDNLSNHEYDPNCQYCVNNVFVKDAKDAETTIVGLREQAERLSTELDKIETELDNIPNPENSLKIHAELERKILNLQRSVNELQRKMSDNKSRCVELANKTQKIEELIHKFVENEGTIKENQGIQLKIASIESKKDEMVSELKSLDRDIIYSSGQVKVAEKTIQDCADSIKKLKELETQFKAYDFYLKAVNRNGVPYELISEALPKVQAEVNSILSQIVDFEILFETDGKSINTYIVYDDENFWPLEMTSGMEKFISSLAIRTALVNVSSLPRPNFMAIDEGWGTLDSDNLNSLYMLFDYMKTQFDFMLTISHIDALRDIVDKVIEIKKENGFSNIRF
jgi:DNA repair exonuclease SbcCD ATPase subunit